MKKVITEEQVKNVKLLRADYEDGQPFARIRVEFQDGKKKTFEMYCGWELFGYIDMWLEVPLNHTSRLQVVEFINSCIDD